VQICPASRFSGALVRDASARRIYQRGLNYRQHGATTNDVGIFLLLVTYLTAFLLTLVLCQNHEQRAARICFVSLECSKLSTGIQYLSGGSRFARYVKKYYLDDATGTSSNRIFSAGFLEMILPFAVVLALRSGGFCLGTLQAGQLRCEKLSPGRSRFLWCFGSFVILLSRRLVFSRSAMGIISALVSTRCYSRARWDFVLADANTVAVGRIIFLGILGLIRLDRQ